MKKSFYFCLLFSLFQLSLMPSAKGSDQSADTIWIKLKNETLIRLTGHDLDRKFQASFDFKPVLTGFLSNWGRLDHQLPSFEKMNILYESNDKSKIRISEGNRTQCFLFSRKDSFVFAVPDTHVLEFNYRNIKTRIYFSDLNQLKDLAAMNTREIFASVKKDMDTGNSVVKKIYPVNRWYSFSEKDELTLVHMEVLSYKQADILEIGAGTNVQVLKGVWAGSFSFSLSAIAGNKLVHRNKISLFYDLVYDFAPGNAPFENHINHFAGIGYAHSDSNHAWSGISLNYLVKRQGDLFEKNTFNIGLTHGLNNRIEVQPMIYFHDFFRNVYPSLKFGVHF